MKAIRFHELGGPEVLRYEDAPVPEPGPGEVLVRVRCAGVNFADTMLTEGRYYLQPVFPQTPGMEVSGEIEAAGQGAEGFAAGDPVMAVLPKAGGYAEYAVASAHHVTRLPTRFSWEEAASLPVQAVTADHVLHLSGRLQPGETVLVHSAAGGTGTFLVQLAKAAGARVIATASSLDKLDLARELGADVLIDYTDPEWPRQVMDATDGRGADVIAEMVGGDVFDGSTRCLAPFGRLVVLGQSSGPPPSLNPLRLMRRNHSVVGYYLMSAIEVPELMKTTNERLFRALSEGKLRVVIGETAPLHYAAEVHRRMLARETTGKLVLQVAGA
jgi:NADPH:quinone reductase